MDNDPMLASLFRESEGRPSTVSELNADIKSVLERSFSSVWVEGEITNFHAAASGHWYFSLTDGDSFLKAACFKGQNLRIRFKPFDGLQVRVRGRITTYEKRGEYQLLVESLEPVGEGALTVAFEQIKAKLRAEGLFDEALKRPLPHYPRKIGVVTSPTGAAIHDILTVLDRRARSVSVVLVPTLVQGERAAEQIAAAISLANKFNNTAEEADRIEVLIVGRGGGSAEDLWAFNEERVARAIRASEIPVISAVGHEVDFTIADMAADLRAPTPSAAAEIVARAEAEIIAHLDRHSSTIRRLAEHRLLEAHAELQSLEKAPVFTEFTSRLEILRHRIDYFLNAQSSSIRSKINNAGRRHSELAARLSPIRLAEGIGQQRGRLDLLHHRILAAAGNVVDARERHLRMAAAKLEALSPLSVLDRGYSITQDSSGRILRDSADIEIGEKIRIRLARGKLEAVVSASEKRADDKI